MCTLWVPETHQLEFCRGALRLPYSLYGIRMDIYGVIGWPIKHSLSPAMHNAAFKKLGIDAEYKKFEVKPEALEDFLINRKEVVGFNITVPHKVRAKEILGKRSEKTLSYVQMSGAINTVKRTKDKFLCLNTDVLGFRRSLKEDLGFEPKDKNIFLVGYGGAGRAIVAALIWENAPHPNKIYIYEASDNTMKSAKEHFEKFAIIKEKLQFITKKEIPSVAASCQLLVNATPVGMKEGDGSPVDKKLLHKDLFIYDVVYNRKTELVKAAKSRAVNGLGMFLYQGAHAFEFWTGQKAPVDTMRKALDSALKTKA